MAFSTTSHTTSQFYQPERPKENIEANDGLSIRSDVNNSNGETIETDFFDFDTYSTVLDSLENCTEKLFSYEKDDINKFYGQYFGVVNLSNYQIRFEE